MWEDIPKEKGPEPGQNMWWQGKAPRKKPSPSFCTKIQYHHPTTSSAKHIQNIGIMISKYQVIANKLSERY